MLFYKFLKILSNATENTKNFKATGKNFLRFADFSNG